MNGSRVRSFSPDPKMRHYQSLDELSLNNSWVTIGSFDGVHRGHQEIFKALSGQAHQNGAEAVVITFFPHPVVVLQGIETAFYLTDPEEKARIMGEFGIDHVITLPFTSEFASQPAAFFIEKLVTHLVMRQVLGGVDFALGRNREGNIEVLKKLGEELNFTVHIIPAITEEGKRISSTDIRHQIIEGRVAEAAELLGRVYSIKGEIVVGDQRGKSIGFPTANLDFWPKLLIPRNGVYATWGRIKDHWYPAVTNIGLRPTFENNSGTPRIEAHLIGFSGDVYGKPMQLDFIKFLRPEKRFPSVEELHKQIDADVKIALEVLGNAR